MFAGASRSVGLQRAPIPGSVSPALFHGGLSVSRNMLGVCRNICMSEGGMCDTTKSAVLQRNSSLNGIAVPYRVRRAWFGRFTGFIQSSQQPLLDNEGPVPFSARVGRTDPSGLPPVLTICRCFACVGPVPPSAGVVCTDPGGRSFRRCLSAWGLYPLPRASSVPTTRDAHSLSHPVAA